MESIEGGALPPEFFFAILSDLLCELLEWKIWDQKLGRILELSDLLDCFAPTAFLDAGLCFARRLAFFLRERVGSGVYRGDGELFGSCHGCFVASTHPPPYLCSIYM